jgi:hypothetical protein
VVAAELRNSSGNFANSFRVFYREATYRRRGIVRRRPGWSHNRRAQPGAGPRPPVVWAAWPLSSSRLVLVLRPVKIRLLELISSNSENISCVAFLKHKNSRKQGTSTVASC